MSSKYFKDTQYESAITMFIVLGVLGLVAGIVLLAMALGIRLKQQLTRTMLRYGIRFVELALSFSNLGLIVFLAVNYVFGKEVGEHNTFPALLGWLVVCYVSVIEIIVGNVRKKYKSDEKYPSSYSATVKTDNSVSKNNDMKEHQVNSPDITHAASEKDLKKCHNALSKFEEINSDSQHNNVPMWKCKHCGCENPTTSDACRSCGRYK